MFEYLQSNTVHSAFNDLIEMSAYDFVWWLVVLYLIRLAIYAVFGGLIGLVQGFRI